MSILACAFVSTHAGRIGRPFGLTANVRLARMQYRIASVPEVRVDAYKQGDPQVFSACSGEGARPGYETIVT